MRERVEGTMSGSASGFAPETWAQRLLPLITVVPYVLLAILAGVTVMVKHSAGGSLLIDLALCAVAAVWMLWMITLHPAWRERPPLMAVFLAGLIAIMAVLVIRDPWFGFFTPAGYFYAFRLLSWPWELGGISGVAMVAGTAQLGSVPSMTFVGLSGYAAVLAVNVLPMCGLAWVGWSADKHNAEREQALAAVGEANRRLEATLAVNAALSQQLMSQARQAGVLDERQRMAREIHDTLAQALAGIVTQLQAAEAAEQDPAGWRRHFAAATGLARESLTEARRSVHELRPEPLAQARLGEALAGVADRWSARHGIPVQVTTTGAVQPARPEVEVALLRAAQEGLANVARHAQATKVGLTLSYLESEVALDLRDDGRGFEPGLTGPAGTGPAGTHLGDARPGDGGFGLVAMRQRIEDLAGTLLIESEPGAGTAISARIPLPAQAHPRTANP